MEGGAVATFGVQLRERVAESDWDRELERPSVLAVAEQLAPADRKTAKASRGALASQADSSLDRLVEAGVVAPWAALARSSLALNQGQNADGGSRDASVNPVGVNASCAAAWAPAAESPSRF